MIHEKFKASIRDDYVEVTDPELAWKAMVAARTPVQTIIGPMWELAGVELFSMKTLEKVQAGLAGYVDGRRYLVVWNPQRSDLIPAVFLDPDHESKEDE